MPLFVFVTGMTNFVTGDAATLSQLLSTERGNTELDSWHELQFRRSFAPDFRKQRKIESSNSGILFFSAEPKLEM